LIAEYTEDALATIKAGRDYDFNTAKAEALFRGWVTSFLPILQDYDVVAVEREFYFPLLNPESEAASKTFVEAGKIDGVLKRKSTGQFCVLEHKTTVSDLGLDSDYWPRLEMDSQISKYVLACKYLGWDTNGVVYDVIRKPGQRPSQIPLLDSDGIKIVKDANGERVKTKDGKKWRQTADTEAGYVLQTRPETPAEYHARILSEMETDPAKYFVKKEIPRLDAHLLEYMQDAWALSQQVLYFRRANLWPRNPAACTAYGTCEFFSLCSGRGCVDGIQYREKAKAHAELDMTETAGKELLTNSRLTALRKCTRYHYHRYEHPIEPGYQDQDALIIGTAFHKAAEIFLRKFIKK